MINMKEVSAFCNMLSQNYGVRFVTNRSMAGYNIIGEFYTQKGQFITLVLEVTKLSVKTKVYDAQRRLLYSDTTKSLMSNQKFMVFIHRLFVT